MKIYKICLGYFERYFKADTFQCICFFDFHALFLKLNGDFFDIDWFGFLAVKDFP